MAEAEDVSPIYISSFLRPYLEDNYATTALESISTNKRRFENLLSPIEGWVMTIQSLLVWERPRNSLILFIFLHFLFWVITSYNVLAVLSWGALTIYLLYIWKTEIWPVVRVPAKTKDQDEWTEVYENLLSVPELSQYLSEYYVTALIYIDAVRNLRRASRMAFLVIAYLCLVPLMLLGILMDAQVILYIAGLTVTLTPPCIHHGVFARVYIAVEPYLMALQYQLKQKLNTGRTRSSPLGDNQAWQAFSDYYVLNPSLSKSKICALVFRDAGAMEREAFDRVAPEAEGVETDSDDDSPAIDPALSAAIARTITDSEDESLAAVSDSRDNSFGEDMMSVSMSSTFAPEVSQMPDFEGVCDEPNSLMPDEDAMPSMDSVDVSRFPHEISDPTDASTDSDIESLPLDSSRPEEVLRMPRQTALASSMITNPMMTSFMNRIGDGIAAIIQPAQGPDFPLLLDSRDRVGDAGANSTDDDMEFEVIDPSEFEPMDVTVEPFRKMQQ